MTLEKINTADSEPSEKQPNTTEIKTLSASSMSDFVLRMEKIANELQSERHFLTTLYNTDPVAFQAELKKKAAGLMVQDGAYPGYRAASDTVQINALLDKYKMLITSELGLSRDASLSDVEIGRRHVQELFETSSTPLSTIGEKLDYLGFKQNDPETGNDSLIFPSKELPHSVNDKWLTYLASVCEHMQLSDNLSKGIGNVSKAEVVAADSLRTGAHDSVTRGILSVLAIDDADIESFKATRKYLGEVRDSVLPAALSIADEGRALVAAQRAQLNVTNALTQRHAKQ